MHALVRFSHVVARDTFTVKELQPQAAQALGCSDGEYQLSSLRYELAKLRAKGLVEKIAHSHRYRLLPKGYRLCVVYLKLFEKIYAPLTAGLQKPLPAEAKMDPQKLTQLDRLYLAVSKALDNLMEGVGLKAA